MDKSDIDTDSVSGGRSLLPAWMVSNMKRLHTFTDFEQYASSPPETENFIPDHPTDSVLTTSGDIGDENLFKENQSSPQKDQTFSHTISTLEKQNLIQNNGPEEGCLQLSKHQSVIDVIKFEDVLYSSPDITPCATPEASPMPQRKLSLKSQNTVQANPKKWFYIESMRNRKFKQAEAFDDCGQLMSRKASEIHEDKRDIHNGKRSKAECAGGVIKLEISNFDINAISPSSW